ncbi:hydrolase [Leptobacterium flavescens]|uniref:Hydrolase n=1 Tax=Leptobacterium flavescens TaxID=472055 RepID=A0A6P0UPD5_9FLAO|nr:hydrolase [Leptobacterium flavescens]NER13818.1 hydrolase [Leptobacterium flavescens]
MKSRIFLYLFIFTLLFVLFQYVNSKNYFKTTEAKIGKLEKDMASQKDSIQDLIFDNLDLQYFALEGNDDALVYYDNLGIQDLPLYISDRLLETNEQGGDNPLVPYAAMTDGGAMKINKIRVLNHKWIIADFSDGKFWGELFITYEIKEDRSVTFEVKEHLLYGRSGF